MTTQQIAQTLMDLGISPQMITARNLIEHKEASDLGLAEMGGRIY